MKFCWFLVIFNLDFPHERDHREAILCKDGIAKHCLFKADSTDVLVGTKRDLMKAPCALAWEGELMIVSSLQSQRVRGEKKAQTVGDQRGRNHSVETGNDDTV